MTVISPASIPGMIEPVEQDLLVDVAENLVLDRDDVVCEVGSYLGRSARCLAEGLLANRTLNLDRRDRPALHAYDVFACEAQGPLARHLLRDIERAGLGALLRRQGSRIDFSGVFDHHMRGLPSGLLMRHQVTLAGASHTGGAIALMHIDAPKWYPEFRQLMATFGPHLKADAYLVLQDYFYHWSAELIAALQVCMDMGLIEPIETAATSLLMRAHSPITPDTLAAVDAAMTDDRVPSLIGRAIDRFVDFEVDRPEVFLSRLYLAAAQHCRERGDGAQGTAWIARMRQSLGDALPPQIASDMAELAHYRHSLRQLYEGDIGQPSGPSGP
jgi:hypothetical protein